MRRVSGGDTGTAAMSFAVNASTMGMAVSGLVVALFAQRINRRLGILVSLALLSIPTALLAVIVDFLFGQAQYWLVPRGVNPLRNS